MKQMPFAVCLGAALLMIGGSAAAQQPNYPKAKE